MKYGLLKMKDGKVGSRQVEKAYLGSNLVWQKQSPVTMDYFTITNNDSSTTYVGMLDAVNQNIEYSLDGGSTWTDWGETEWAGISLASGQSVKFKGVNDTFNLSDADYCTFHLANNGNLSLSGNIMSLVDGQADGTKIIPSTYFFYGLFDSCTIIRDASQLVLPATTLSEYCYGKLFYYCSGLTVAPELQATTLASGCYYSMFYGCSSLTAAPELPATTLTSVCYSYMFWGCSGISLLNYPNIDIWPEVVDINRPTLGFAGGSNTIHPPVKLYISKLLSDVNYGCPFFFALANTIYGTYNCYFNLQSLPNNFSLSTSNLISAGSNKMTLTYNIYTDISSLKDQALALVGQYTIINVFHLDETPWE